MELRALGQIPGAVHIPLNELRDRILELDRTKTYVIYCAVGMRAYVAYRILKHHGFKALNLSGGFVLYRAVRNRLEAALAAGA
jgi:rhodanese-related sulfurtransferase